MLTDEGRLARWNSNAASAVVDWRPMATKLSCFWDDARPSDVDYDFVTGEALRDQGGKREAMRRSLVDSFTASPQR